MKIEISKCHNHVLQTISQTIYVKKERKEKKKKKREREKKESNRRLKRSLYMEAKQEKIIKHVDEGNGVSITDYQTSMCR